MPTTYQDISRQRFDLARALSQICDAKIIAVGDDWQGDGTTGQRRIVVEGFDPPCFAEFRISGGGSVEES